MRTYLIELTAIVDAIGTSVTLRYSDKGFTTEPTDTPPNAIYEPRLKQPALIRRDMYSNGTTGGASRIGFGELILSNADGGLDYLQDYGFDGQKVIVKVGDSDGDFALFNTVLTATIEQIELTQRELTIRVRDRQFELDEPIQETRYLGNGNLEGNDQVEGQVKPLVYGRVFNATPKLISPALLIYQFADNPNVALDALYEGGLLITNGGDYANETELLTVAPAAGQYRRFEGYFRLGSSPVFPITLDASEGVLADRSVAQILKKLALRVGILLADIDAQDVLDLDTINSAEVGIYIDSEATALQAMDEVANSIGAYFGFDQNGLFRMGRLSNPVGTPIISLNESLIIGNELERQVSQDTDRGIPAHKVNLNYRRNYTVQNRSDLAGAVLDARIQDVAEANLSVSVEDAAVLNKHKLASEITRNTLLLNKADASAEASRLLALYSVRRDVYNVTVRLEDEFIALLDVGEEIEIVYRRFGLGLGKSFILIGLEVDYQLNRASMTLWG